MVRHSSASTREQTPHVTTDTISNAVKRRAQSVMENKSIDAGTRAVIRYGLEINDPWLPELVHRAESGENIVTTLDSGALNDS